MRMHKLLAALAICASVGLYGSVGPPEAATDQSMERYAFDIGIDSNIVTEPAAPAASYAVLQSGVDHDIGMAATSIPIYLCASGFDSRTSEVVAVLAPRVSTQIKRTNFAYLHDVGGRASPITKMSVQSFRPRVVRI